MPEPTTFDVLVEQPHTDANEYAYDASAHAVRLERVVRVSEPTFADRGIVADAVTPRGEPLRAYLISDLAVSPHARVAAHAVGALEFARGELLDRVIVAVPHADARYAHARSFNDLPAPHRAALQRLIAESARWLDTQSAEELVHLARHRARLARVEQGEHERTRPAWEADESRAMLDRIARETDLHTQAELALFTLPYRFQQYVRLCLTPDERIIYWAHRPRFAVSHWARIRSKSLREGLLLVTDQQLLWIIEPVAPTVPVEGYGYVARTTALELLAGASIEQKERYAILRVASTNAIGESVTFSIEFPDTACDELPQVVRLLRAFAPRANDCRLRRVVIPRPPTIRLDDPMESDHAKTAATIEHLQNALATQLNNETICAQAFVPAWADGGAKLLTVTHRNLRFTSLNTSPTVYDVRTIAAIEICFSVLGSWFRVVFPSGKPFELAFPLTAFKGFNACWLALRQMSSVLLTLTPPT
jgi:inorganic pyrophosphatase